MRNSDYLYWSYCTRNRAITKAYNYIWFFFPSFLFYIFIHLFTANSEEEFPQDISSFLMSVTGSTIYKLKQLVDELSKVATDSGKNENQFLLALRMTK